MDTRRIKVVVEWDPDDHVYVTTVPALNYLSTYGDTREEALERTREAIALYIDTAEQEGVPVPRLDVEADIVEIEVPA